MFEIWIDTLCPQIMKADVMAHVKTNKELYQTKKIYASGSSWNQK